MRWRDAHWSRTRVSAEGSRAATPVLAPSPEQPLERGSPPTFSVIVAAYQAADVIGDALASLARQTVAPLEVIVCDDGSTDGLEAALAPFRSEILLLQKPHGGEASAKNAAAAAAGGDFLLILDADDVYLPRRIEALTDLAHARPDLDILTTDAYLVVGERRVRRAYHRYWPFETYDQRRAILRRNFVFGLAAVRRDRFVEHGGFDESILWTTDWDLWLRMILDGSRAGLVPEPLALYRLSETSLTANRRDLVLGKISTLEKARHNRALTPGDRTVLSGSLDTYRRELSILDLQAALTSGDPAARRRARAVLVTRGFPLRSRLQAAGATVAPGTMGWLLRRRAARSWVGASGIRVSRTTGGGLRARILRWARVRDA
jgi:glycosyltransferase involved in cell wall biosynthesis